MITLTKKKAEFLEEIGAIKRVFIHTKHYKPINSITIYKAFFEKYKTAGNIWISLYAFYKKTL